MHKFCFYLSWDGITPEAWAAWVQAIGTVAVFAWAVWIHFSEKWKSAKFEADLREQETHSAALQVLRRFNSMFGWLSEMGDHPNTRWRDMGDPFGQYAEDPGSSSRSLGSAGKSFDDFIAKCHQAWEWCAAMTLRDPNDQDHTSPQAKQTLAKVQAAIAAGHVLKAKLYDVAGIDPAPARNR